MWAKKRGGGKEESGKWGKAECCAEGGREEGRAVGGVMAAENYTSTHRGREMTVTIISSWNSNKWFTMNKLAGVLYSIIIIITKKELGF